MDELKNTGESFTTFYYAKMDDANTRAELKALYVRHAQVPNEHVVLISLSQNETSMMTWEGSPILGQTNIMEKLAVRTITTRGDRTLISNSQGMPKLGHQGLTIDVQPSSHQVPNLLVSVNGQLLVCNFCEIHQCVLNFSLVIHRWTMAHQCISIRCSSLSMCQGLRLLITCTNCIPCQTLKPSHSSHHLTDKMISSGSSSFEPCM